MVDKKYVKHIAELARIDFSDQEIEKMEKELSLILDYFNLIREVDVSGVEPISYLNMNKNVMRKDEAFPKSDEEIEEIIKAFPEKQGRHLKIKAILK